MSRPPPEEKAALAGGLFEIPESIPTTAKPAARQQPTPAHEPAPSDVQQIHVGRAIAGEITKEEPDRFLATDGRGKRISVFETRSQAAGAIFEHSRGAK
jgi:hypothetical protein